MEKIEVDLERAMRQMFRWQLVYSILSEEAEYESPRSLEQVVLELQKVWDRQFKEITNRERSIATILPLELI